MTCKDSYPAALGLKAAVIIWCACAALFAGGCKKDDNSSLPFYLGPSLYVEPFDNVTDSAGFTGVGGTFVSWGDYDNDGFEDLIIDGRRLFRNNGDLTFTDTTLAAGIDPLGGGAGAAWADIDNDGYLDLFCSGYVDATPSDLDRLYLNDGDGTFTDITASAGVSDDRDSRACAWGDFNRDGYIDLYVVNYEYPPGAAAEDRLYINDKDNTFTNATVTSGVSATTPSAGRAVACCDFDDDGDLDIFVANDKLGPNFLLENDGSGSFTNRAADAYVEGCNEGGLGLFGSSTGVSWGDYDNDNDFDMFVTNQRSSWPQYYEDESQLFMNINGVIDFSDMYPDSWVKADKLALCPAWFDYNNDTQLDFYLCTGSGSGKLYNGHTTGAFYNVAGRAALAVKNPVGCALADYDNNGGLDIFICATDKVYLFRNTHDQYNWLKVELVGAAANRAAIGSIVRVTCPCVTPDTITRQIAGSNGTGCQDSLIAHFGMGNHGGPYTIDIIWADGSASTQQVTDAAINQLHVIAQ
jgi:hypothetical protein